MDTTPRALTVPQVAELLQLHTRTVYRLVERGEIASVRIGTSIRIPASALDAFLTDDNAGLTVA